MKSKALIVSGSIATIIFLSSVVFAQTTSRETQREKMKKSIKECLQSKINATKNQGDYDFSLVHNSLRRTYSVHVPPSYDGTTPIPLVLVLHGGGGNGKSMRLLTLMDATSDKYGFIVAYPSGTGTKIGKKVVGSWNAGRCCPKAMANNVDDVGFISQLIDKLRKNFNIDRNKIYATGHSNGSQMSFRLACELSDKIAAIAPLGAQGVLDNCSPRRPVPVMYFHGADDPCSPYNGGIAGGCANEYLENVFKIKHTPYTWAIDSVPAYIKKWRIINKVSDKARVVYQKGAAICVSWGTDTNREVVLCTIKEMGHTWPSGSYGAPCAKGIGTGKCRAFRAIVGEMNYDISANEVMWEFFKRHPKQPEDTENL